MALTYDLSFASQFVLKQIALEKLVPTQRDEYALRREQFCAAVTSRWNLRAFTTLASACLLLDLERYSIK